jgi:type I restriction enzyme S subunit
VIRLQNIGHFQFNDDQAHISHEHFERLRAHEVRPNELLIAGLGEDLPRACLAPASLGPAIVKADCFRVRLHPAVSPGYVCAALNSPQVRSAASQQISGVGRPRLNLRKVRDIRLAIPPAAEQQRIVAAIEEQFSRIDAGVAALDRVRQNLKRIQEAVLHHLVGFGTAADLPYGWQWVTIRDVAGDDASPVLTGPFGTTLGRSDFVQDGVPVLTIGCLTSHGIQIDNTPRVSEAKAKSLRRYALIPGDVLFSRMATVGRAEVVGQAEAGSLINYHLMRLRLDQTTILPQFLTLLCRGSRAIHEYLTESNHGVTRPGINTKQLLNLPVALPSMREQQKIVGRAHGIDSFASTLETDIDLAVRRARQLRSSVLAAALSGTLVAQDPSDEPASVLLDLIRAERRSSKAGGTVHARKTRTPPHKAIT